MKNPDACGNRSLRIDFHFIPLITKKYMASTHSTMLPLGTPAPAFSLPDTDGRLVTLGDFQASPALLVVFMCNHCPYVVHIRDALVAFARAFQPLGLATVGINANDAQQYPADSPEQMAVEAARAGYPFPYLYDESQETAKAYRAACTPDFFLFGPQRLLVYRGQFDDSRPGNKVPVTGKDLRAAVEALLANQPNPSPQFASLGCNIKWKPGNAPDDY